MSSVVLGRAVPALIAPARFATNRLLRLQDLIHRRRSAERLLYGQERAFLLALLDRAILSTYSDCREAGVEDEALRLLLRSCIERDDALPAAA